MLDKEDSGLEGADQLLELEAGVDVDEVERLVPDVEMGRLAETARQQGPSGLAQVGDIPREIPEGDRRPDGPAVGQAAAEQPEEGGLSAVFPRSFRGRSGPRSPAFQLVSSRRFRSSKPGTGLDG